uniref:Coiled-coil domain-containing protein 146-like n=1 Tax=Petromyzon marinus TaxID=7757 RepID=A0AAJ7U018_PETMA|nr:coiled-coil domain-containing protein 146-like [Petromyzon marinus]
MSSSDHEDDGEWNEEEEEEEEKTEDAEQLAKSERDEERKDVGSGKEEEEEEGEEGAWEGDEGDYEDALAPVEIRGPFLPCPPPISSLQQGFVEVSASPAFHCLDQLFHTGQITGARVAQLKELYSRLQESFKLTRDSEEALLRETKRYTEELQGQRGQLESADAFPDGQSTDVGRLRSQLLRHHNALSQSEETHTQLHYKIQSLQDEKNLLQKEYERMPKPGDLERKAKLVMEGCEDLRREVSQRKAEVQSLQEELESRQGQMIRDQKSLNQQKIMRENLKNELVQIHMVPGEIMKEIKAVEHKKQEQEERRAALEAQSRDAQAALAGAAVRAEEARHEAVAVAEELDARRTQLDAQRHELQRLARDLAFAGEREAQRQGDRATCDLRLRHAGVEKRAQHELLLQREREKERELRALAKADKQLKAARDALALVQSAHAKTHAQVDSMPQDDGSNAHRIKELRDDIEAKKRQLLKEESLSEAEARAMEAHLAEEARLGGLHMELREQLRSLLHLAQVKAEEREQKSRDSAKAKIRYERILQEVKAKDLSIVDHKKRHQEIVLRLKEFSQLYNVIKLERNRCANMILAAAQQSAETREKLKILENELEILVSSSSSKALMIQKQRKKHQTVALSRDTARADTTRCGREGRELEERHQRSQEALARLRAHVERAQSGSRELRSRYEEAVRQRRARASQLLELEGEVCALYERLHVGDTAAREGHVALQALEEEARFLAMARLEETRQLGLARRDGPSRRMLDEQLIGLHLQLLQYQDHIRELEGQLEDPEGRRVRFLEGKDLSPSELARKTEELEEQLAHKEEQLLEKQLVLEQVSRLAERADAQAREGHNDTLSLAGKMNGVRGRLRARTRRLMALVSELAMRQAAALRLQQEVRERAALVESCHARLAQGLAPCDGAEREWRSALRDEHRRRCERLARQKEEAAAADRTMAGDGAASTAEPRPNCYIPDDDLGLPVPRPYGALAPFKPSETGASMRHIRKPSIKPIEI